MEALQAGVEQTGAALSRYLEKYVYSLASHQEYIEKRVGLERLMSLKQQATIKEGYYL
jgi:glutaconate CoA-transferase subunit A